MIISYGWDTNAARDVKDKKQLLYVRSQKKKEKKKKRDIKTFQTPVRLQHSRLPLSHSKPWTVMQAILRVSAKWISGLM